ncbi:MAG: SMC-Scp complex subunit ScpB, partial [Halanaerobacter sp.]
MTEAEKKAELEALLFMATEPIKTAEIKEVTAFDKEEIQDYLAQLEEEYSSPERGIELVEFNEGYIFQTKAKYKETIKEHHQPE